MRRLLLVMFLMPLSPITASALVISSTNVSSVQFGGAETLLVKGKDKWKAKKWKGQRCKYEWKQDRKGYREKFKCK